MKPPFGLYWRTLRHLTLRQLVYQLWNRVRGRPRLRWTDTHKPVNVPSLQFPITFTFLNQSVTFIDHIDWNYAKNGKLWTYTLNYFEELTEENQGLALIYDFIRQTNSLIDGLEPYPTSLRVLNWLAFLDRYQIQDSVIERHLYAQTALLRSRLEYHLGGNHLLENACALTVMAVHFQHKHWFCKGATLLQAELDEQILADGGHYERSPIYHQILTNRLLDVYSLLQSDNWVTDFELVRYVQNKTTAMLNWLVAITFRNGSVPMVNDSADGVATTTAELLVKATSLGFRPRPALLSDSGYRMLKTDHFEVFIDIGPVGPDHQPGHAHADTFSFMLHIDGQPIIVDPGTSTYQIGARRSWERSTAAHNTVTVEGHDSSEVWSGFRVGRRAAVQVHTDTLQCIEATHDGYTYLGEHHTRRWTLIDNTTLSVTDSFTNRELAKTYNLYFDHCLSIKTYQNNIYVPLCSVSFASDELLTLNQSTYDQAIGFNRTNTASKVTLNVPSQLTTFFILRP